MADSKENFDCMLCKNVAHSRVEAQHHFQSVHKDTTARECPVCWKELSTPTSIRRHVRKQHAKHSNLANELLAKYFPGSANAAGKRVHSNGEDDMPASTSAKTDRGSDSEDTIVEAASPEAVQFIDLSKAEVEPSGGKGSEKMATPTSERSSSKSTDKDSDIANKMETEQKLAQSDSPQASTSTADVNMLSATFVKNKYAATTEELRLLQRMLCAVDFRLGLDFGNMVSLDN